MNGLFVFTIGVIMKLLVSLFCFSILTACQDVKENKKETETVAAKEEKKQDKIEMLTLYAAINAKDHAKQDEFEGFWSKMDEAHQLDALQQVRTGHRFEVSTDITPLVKEHQALIQKKGEDSDNKRIMEIAKKSSEDIAQHAFYLRQGLVFWNVAKKSKSPAILAEVGLLEQQLRTSLEHFAEVLRFVDVYSLVPNQDSLPCENVDKFHCELEGEKLDVLRIHIKKGTDPSDINFDAKILDLLRFSKVHFVVDGKEDVNLALSPNPTIKFSDPTYVQEVADFLASYGWFRLEKNEKTNKFKLIHQK